jgi:poly-gamma-glutamate capsule biosynthesis protein CapA/YwtB (metallophosphatase superfamily)
MHPEKYYGTRDNPKPVNAAAKAAKLGAEWKTSYKSVFGEFMLGQLLELHMNSDRAKRAAAGWGGDEVLLLENGAGQNAVWIETEWDTAAAAEKFFDAMDEWFRLRHPKASRRAAPEGFSLVQNGEYSALFRETTGVRVILGIPEAEGKKLDK